MENWWQQVWNTLQADFGDLPDAAHVTRLVVRMLLASIAGGLLGFERQMAGKAAGVRTHMLVAMGSAFFVFIPQQAGMDLPDMSRVIQGVATGIGFIGAGAVLKLTEQGQIRGVTTAASIWLTAAIGIAIGIGREASAVVVTALGLLILAIFRTKNPRANHENRP